MTRKIFKNATKGRVAFLYEYSDNYFVSFIPSPASRTRWMKKTHKTRKGALGCLSAYGYRLD